MPARRLLQALHHARDPRAGERAAGEDERGDRDAIGQVVLRDGAARSLLQPERAQIRIAKDPGPVRRGERSGRPGSPRPGKQRPRRERGQHDADTDSIRCGHDRMLDLEVDRTRECDVVSPRAILAGQVGAHRPLTA